MHEKKLRFFLVFATGHFGQRYTIFPHLVGVTDSKSLVNMSLYVLRYTLKKPENSIMSYRRIFYLTTLKPLGKKFYNQEARSETKILKKYISCKISFQK